MNRQTIVITGGGSGFGAALARELSARDANVVISGRDEDKLAKVTAELGDNRSARVVCDVTSADDLERLWSASIERFGRVDHWINNAGVGAPRHPLAEMSVADVETVIRINLIGALLGARCAIRGMRAQGGGHVWVTEGLGSSGPVMPGTSGYSASKAGVTRSFAVLAKEARGTGVSIGYLRPGIMPTSVVTGHDSGGTDKESIKMLNMLGDRPEAIAPSFANGILRRPPNGTRLTWLTPPRLAGRLLLAPFRQRSVV